MVTIEAFRKMVLAFDSVSVLPHFEKTSFRIKKKIFATLDEKNGLVTLKFKEPDQSVFCLIPNKTFYPANGAWGKNGWTIADLSKVNKPMLAEALKKSYLNVSGNK